MKCYLLQQLGGGPQFDDVYLSTLADVRQTIRDFVAPFHYDTLSVALIQFDHSRTNLLAMLSGEGKVEVLKRWDVKPNGALSADN
jgi:hypothetical protein